MAVHPADEAGDQPKKWMNGNRNAPWNDDHFFLFIASRIDWPISAGLLVKTAPHFWKAAYLSAAVPLPPEMIAPAWPILFPGGAVAPAMKTARGLVRWRAAHSAACSS